MAKQWSHTVDLQTDEAGKPLMETAILALAALIENGRLKVNAAGLTLNVDNINLDEAALVAAVGGLATVLNKPAQAGEAAAATASLATEVTLGQVKTALGSPAQANEAAAATAALATEVTLGQIKTALGSPAQAAEAAAAATAILAALAPLPKAAFLRVPIDQTAGVGETELVAATPDKVARLHALVLVLETGGTVAVEDTDDAALSGPMPFAAMGGPVIPYTSQTEGCLASPSGKGLQIRTTAKAFGYAVVSLE